MVLNYIRESLSPFLFVIVMDRLSDEVRQMFPWTMIYSESNEQVEESFEMVEVWSEEKSNESQ